MAIRFQYEPVGIGGLAGYAAGAGRARQRGLKYAMDLAQRGQERRDRFNLQGRQQQFALEQQNREIDARFFQNAAQNEAALGRLKYSEMAAKERQQDVLTQQGQQRLEQQTMEGIKRGQLELPPAAQQELDKLNADSVAALKLGPDQFAEFQKQAEVKRRGLLGTATPRKAPTDEEIITQKLGQWRIDNPKAPVVVDSKGEVSLLPGWKPPEDPAVAQAKAAKERDKDFAKEVDRVSKDPKFEESSYDAQAKEAQKRMEKRKEILGGTAPAEPDSTETYPSAAGGWEARRAYQEAAQGGAAPTAMAPPQAQPLPEGVPPTSTWIGNDTIRLPDGRIIRRKKE